MRDECKEGYKVHLARDHPLSKLQCMHVRKQISQQSMIRMSTMRHGRALRDNLSHSCTLIRKVKRVQDAKFDAQHLFTAEYVTRESVKL